MYDSKLERAKHLTRLARAFYDSVDHEYDKQRLELHRLVAVKLAGLINEAINMDDTLQPDLGLSLILFTEQKQDDMDTGDDAEALRILETLEREYGLA